MAYSVLNDLSMILEQIALKEEQDFDEVLYVVTLRCEWFVNLNKIWMEMFINNCKTIQLMVKITF